MKVALVLPNWVGDVAMATPALRALWRHFGPRARLIGVARPYVADVLAGTVWLDELVLHDRRSRDARLRTGAVLARLRQQKLDACVLFTNSLRSGWLAWRSGARERVGYARNLRGPLLTRRLHAPRDGWRWRPISAVDYYLELAYALGCPPEPRRLELTTLPTDEQAADAVWSKLGLERAPGVIAFGCGGAYGAAKHWPREQFAELARRIVDRSGYAVLVLCGPAERETAAWIAAAAGHERVRSLADEPPRLGLTKACLRRCQLLVSTDSGPRHLAAAFGTPCVSLFGPTDPRWAENGHLADVHLRRELSCSPCGQRVCPLGHHLCLAGLSVDTVWRAARSLLDADALHAA